MPSQDLSHGQGLTMGRVRHICDARLDAAVSVAVACVVGHKPGRAQRMRCRVSPTGAHDAASRAPGGDGGT